MDPINNIQKDNQEHKDHRDLNPILTIEQMGNYILHFVFSDKQEVTINFKSYLQRRKSFDKYLDPSLFSQWKIKGSMIYWPGNIFDFPSWILLRENPPGEKVG